ncbi:MAG TPA: S26 family signal peptidase [Caulobacterales bacterium]|nr:S26 family signal peptidase [Caulobacterales bacterium]
MRSRRLLILGAVSAIGIAFALASFGARPALIWNFTASAPVGLYRTLDRDWVPGDWVAVEPSHALRATMTELGVLERGRLLVKRAAASAGDEVCRDGLRVTINGQEAVVARAQASSGAPLPAWSGCRQLGPHEIFLLGQADGSFDGRYFGVTQASEVIAPLEHLAPKGPSDP